MQPLIHRAALLRAELHRPPAFNLFTLLRSSSDEVRLHSRYLAFLLNPQGAHGAGTKLLQLLLAALNIEGFDCTEVTVEVEYRNVDILIRNSKRQAVIIENKLYAADQDAQLHRYLQTLQGEGCRTYPPLYLTLDGRDADRRSCLGIDYQRISYANDILPWLEQCQQWVIREAGVRESLLQYIDLVATLTFQNQGHAYMDALKQTLRQNNNLLVVRDLQKAFVETLKDLQLEFWQALAQCIKEKYPELPKPSDAPTAEVVDRYYSATRDNRWYGLYYDLGFVPGSVYIELDHRFYCGYYCDAQSHPTAHAWLTTLTQKVVNNGVGSGGLLWRYTTELNMKNPSDEDLMVLNEPMKKAQAVERMADDVYGLWGEARALYAVEG
ncbi:PD-(D/E)XK nuclease family protein [Pseudomonas sp. MH9.3]|uniref:PDDEXK-like family protein n=1 Tax=Pseudomonas sp. MH9.3 TaxID=3048630 RepID=UPI002AC95A6C|nr:PD-(D/E)XK nuclease family protein [Pseudomonas sp. MH9.3]MEB0107991.1 PD-(D/E)XK nuclease family protein [Pseudomonas sp. MH9.3]WPX80924.1 PD-(D/E)XK nuclease family protein [Pseudomonas sp. MH9.3]